MLEKIAESIFNKYGIDFKKARKGRGWTNATWIAGGLVLRLSTKKDEDKLRREVQLANYLPKLVGYPINVDVGVTEGYEWSLSKEIKGQNLSEIWPYLSLTEKTLVVKQIWEMVDAVHSIDLSKVEHLSRKRAWYNSCDQDKAFRNIDHLVEKKLFKISQGHLLNEMLNNFWEVVNTNPVVLNHGDITLDNLLWCDGKVVSLLDFEFSVIAPVQLDITYLVRLVFSPNMNDDIKSYEDYISFGLLQQEIINMVNSSHFRYKSELLLGYTLLLELTKLELKLANSNNDEIIENWDSYQRLVSIANNNGGYLKPLLDI